MPQKTIYIRDEDVEFFDEAVKKLGNGRGIGSLIVGLLKEQMKKLDDETDEAMSLKMLEFCNPPPLTH